MNYKEKTSIQNIRLYRPELDAGTIYDAAKKIADRTDYCAGHFLRISALRAAQNMPLLWEV